MRSPGFAAASQRRWSVVASVIAVGSAAATSRANDGPPSVAKHTGDNGRDHLAHAAKAAVLDAFGSRDEDVLQIADAVRAQRLFRRSIPME